MSLWLSCHPLETPFYQAHGVGAVVLAALLGGAIITESVFNYDGLGKLARDAATTWDLPITVGIVLLLATFVIIANIIVDVLYAVIDPRVKYV